MSRLAIPLFALLLAATAGSTAQQSSPMPAPGARVYVAEMDDAFNFPLTRAFKSRKVPVVLVESRDEAEYEITGHASSQQAGLTRALLTGAVGSDEEASIQVVHLQTGDVVFAYSVSKRDAAHGRDSTADACAKHFKDAIEHARAQSRGGR
jgi:hypothetical protein